MTEKFYSRKLEIVRAVQWFKEGDHPDVRESADSDPSEQSVTGYLHTISGVYTVYPGDWIVSLPDGTQQVMSKTLFNRMYEEVGKGNI